MTHSSSFISEKSGCDCLIELCRRVFFNSISRDLISRNSLRIFSSTGTYPRRIGRPSASLSICVDETFSNGINADGRLFISIGDYKKIIS